MQSYIPIREGGDGMISVKDIANACNVSVATVSKALNGYSDISEETKTMIKAKAAELGYIPNMAAVALKTNRTYNIGILFVDAANTGLTHMSILRGFLRESGLRQRSWDTVLRL